MTKQQKLNRMKTEDLAEFIEMNICNMCHFCIFYKTKGCKVRVKCKEGIKKYLESEEK